MIFSNFKGRILTGLWAEFVNNFEKKLDESCDETLLKAWESSGNRTSFYESSLLRNVASEMSMVFKNEDFKIDYTFCKRMDGHYDVPLIFIESENVAASADHEMRKLCCLQAPLKVLIVCAEWSEEPGFWSHGGDKNRLLKKWSSQIRMHNKVWPSPSITGVIVAEWRDSLRYYSIAFDHFGEVVDQHRMFFCRDCEERNEE
ncbi:MAG: hypothetical protein AWU57_1278 [Marinobacter sp. T13-3]|nr:MAG: hypothetical protein AWU57_1278 [Marinobacter sp. T13-3]